MKDRQFTHPNFGNEVRVEVVGREVRLVFVASSEERADDLGEAIVSELENGAITLTMMGRPTSIVEQ